MKHLFHILIYFAAAGIVCGSDFTDPKTVNESKDIASHRKLTVAQIPIQEVAEPWRNKVQNILEKGEVYSRGNAEAFPCRSEVYRWVLDNSDASLFAWKTLGATKAIILRQKDGSFVGSDGHGSEVTWRLVWSGDQHRVWLAEGGGRPVPLLPEIKVQAVIVIHFQDVVSVDGRKGIRHRVELFADHDSKPGIFSKISGLTPEAIAKKANQQVELFFSGMAWYACEHADWAKTTWTKWANTPDSQLRIQSVLSELEQLKKKPITSTSK